MKLKKDIIVKVLKYVWLVAVIVGGIYYVDKNYTQAIGYLRSINPVKLTISFTLIIIVRLINIYLVQHSLELFGWKPKFVEAFKFVSISQLGKYIPGGVWQFVARFTAYKENNLSVKNMGKSFLVENLWMVLGSLFVGIFFIGISPPISTLNSLGIEVSANVIKFTAITSLVLFLITIVVIEVKFRSAETRPIIGNILSQIVTQVTMWILFGISFFVLFSKIGTFSDLLFSIGAYAISFLAGYVAIFAPGGIGIREYIAVLLFSTMFNVGEIGILTIVHRLLYTVAEFIFAGFAYIMTKKGKDQDNEKK